MFLVYHYTSSPTILNVISNLFYGLNCFLVRKKISPDPFAGSGVYYGIRKFAFDTIGGERIEEVLWVIGRGGQYGFRMHEYR